MCPIFRFIISFRREFLTATRLERARHGLRCTALLGRAMPYENRHGNRCTELWRGPLTLHGDNHPREIPTALGRGQSTLHTLMRQCPTFAYTNEAQRQNSPGTWPACVDRASIVEGIGKVASGVSRTERRDKPRFQTITLVAANS